MPYGEVGASAQPRPRLHTGVDEAAAASARAALASGELSPEDAEILVDQGLLDQQDFDAVFGWDEDGQEHKDEWDQTTLAAAVDLAASEDGFFTMEQVARLWVDDAFREQRILPLARRYRSEHRARLQALNRAALSRTRTPIRRPLRRGSVRRVRAHRRVRARSPSRKQGDPDPLASAGRRA